MTAEQLLVLMAANETEASARTKVTRCTCSLHAYTPTCLDNVVVECLASPFVISGRFRHVACHHMSQFYNGHCVCVHTVMHMRLLLSKSVNGVS